MRVIATECSAEQQEKDMPELLAMNAEKLEIEIMWEFFGGILTTLEGRQYQVLGE